MTRTQPIAPASSAFSLWLLGEEGGGNVTKITLGMCGDDYHQLQIQAGTAITSFGCVHSATKPNRTILVVGFG
jgi:hypothetical protein